MAGTSNTGDSTATPTPFDYHHQSATISGLSLGLIQILADKFSSSQRCSPDNFLPCIFFLRKSSSTMDKEAVMVEDLPFPSEMTAADGKPLQLLGHGITDIEIHFLQIKFTAIGVYLDKDSIVDCLARWKGKTEEELTKDNLFYEAIISSPSEKVLRVVVIKEIKGSQYGVQLQSSVRDRLAAEDKFEDEEDEELEKIAEFFQSKYFKKGTVIVYCFQPATKTAEVTLVINEKEESKLKIGNANVVDMIQKWYLGGDRSVSPTTIKSLTGKLVGVLSQ